MLIAALQTCQQTLINLTRHHFTTSDHLFAHRSEHALNTQLADLGLDDLWGQQCFHGLLGIIK